MPFLIIAALVTAIVLWLAVRAPAGRGSGSHPCKTCRHCGKPFDDGVLCRFGHREVFKTEQHIANCIDYEPRRR